MKTSTIIVTTLFVGAAGIIVAALSTTDRDSRANNRISRKGLLYKDYIMDKLYDYTDMILHPFEKTNDISSRINKILNTKSIKIKAETNQT